MFKLILGLTSPVVGILHHICGIFANLRIDAVVKEVPPFVAIGVCVLAVITLFPGLVPWLLELVLRIGRVPIWRVL